MHPNNRHIQTHNLPGFISFAEVGGGGGLIEEKPSDDVRNAATTSYSSDIVNHYTWQGRKLGKKLYSDQGTLTLDETYYDELTLNFGQPTRLLHADGYVDVSAQVPVFYYHLKDHLGNVRLVITPAGSSNQPEIVQAMEYYPFGMRFESSIPNESDHNHMPNKHTYNSNEEQEMPGRWLDYGFRFYDSQIARFHSVDPLGHSFSSQSPYVYAGNNPISFIDFMGLSPLLSSVLRGQSSFSFEMTDEDWIKATRPIGLEGVESKEKKKKTDKNTESQTSQQNGNGKKKKDGKGNLASGGGGGSGLPTIDGVTAPWSHEYITEKAFQILTDPRVGIAADLADWMRFTKGAGNTITLITVASDSYQRFYKQSIDNMTFGYRLTTTGLATWVGYSTGPIGGITVGLYSTGIEETAKAGAKLEIQMRNYFNPTTKGSFWSKFYW